VRGTAQQKRRDDGQQAHRPLLRQAWLMARKVAQKDDGAAS
jgi:hypothetical protein